MIRSSLAERPTNIQLELRWTLSTKSWTNEWIYNPGSRWGQDKIEGMRKEGRRFLYNGLASPYMNRPNESHLQKKHLLTNEANSTSTVFSINTSSSFNAIIRVLDGLLLGT